MIIFITLVLLSLGFGTITYFSIYYPDTHLLWVLFLSAFFYFFFLIVVYLLFVALFGTIYQHRKVPTPNKPNRFGLFMLEQTSFLLVHMFGGILHFSGLGKLPPLRKRFMLVTNHLSAWDQIGLFALLAGRRIIYVSKKENESLFAAGGWIKYAGNLSIDQHDIKSGQAVIEHAGNLIKDGACSIGICPEGTRNKTFPDPFLLPFHPGSFQMAMIAKCPIVVVCIQNTNALFKRFPRWSRLYFDCVAVLEYEDYKDMSLTEIATYCHDKILDRMNKKSSRIYHLKKKKKDE